MIMAKKTLKYLLSLMDVIGKITKAYNSVNMGKNGQF